jgi:predicted secreted protein
MVKRRKNQRFEDHLCTLLQVTDVSGETVLVRDTGRPEFHDHVGSLANGSQQRAEMVLETLDFSSLNHLTRLAAREYFEYDIYTQ